MDFEQVAANLVAYGLADVIETHRLDEHGHGLPWELVASVGHVESEHDPYAFNFYRKGEDGKQHLCRGRWDGEDATLPDGEGDKPHAWAAGWLQIIRPYPRGLTLRQMFDPAEEARVILPELRRYYQRASAAGLTGRDLYAAVYFGHNQGPVRLYAGLSHAAKGIVSIINNSGIDEAPRAQRALVVALKVASLVPQWAKWRADNGGQP